MRYALFVASILVLPHNIAFADLGIMDTASESAAKNGAAGVGITQIYDHPADSLNGQFVVPVQYNRTSAEGNGTEHDNNDSKPNDIDYIPLSQLKGATGAQGVAGVQGTTGVQGTQGNTGNSGKAGTNGKNGVDGVNGRNLEAPTIDPRLDVEVREFDSKHWSVSSYASFALQTGAARYIVGQKLILKIGRSYEEKQRELLEQKLRKLLEERAK